MPRFWNWHDGSEDTESRAVLVLSGAIDSGESWYDDAVWPARFREELSAHAGESIQVEINSPEDAVKLGIGYLSEDRKRFGLVLGKSVAENSTLASLKDFMSGIFINKKKEDDTAAQYVKSLKTKTPSVNQLLVNLSGGNQQNLYS